MSNKTEESLLAAQEIILAEFGQPESLWHPDFGWVMLKGKPTETTKEFLKWLMTH